jgi:hypothetical protein
LKKTHHRKGLVEWLKVQGLSSNPSTENKNKSQEPVTHGGNPSYSGGKDYQNQGSKPVLGK